MSQIVLYIKCVISKSNALNYQHIMITLQCPHYYTFIILLINTRKITFIQYANVAIVYCLRYY